jgi:hypothetical protein
VPGVSTLVASAGAASVDLAVGALQRRFTRLRRSWGGEPQLTVPTSGPEGRPNQVSSAR